MTPEWQGIPGETIARMCRAEAIEVPAPARFHHPT